MSCTHSMIARQNGLLLLQINTSDTNHSFSFASLHATLCGSFLISGHKFHVFRGVFFKRLWVLEVFRCWSTNSRPSLRVRIQSNAQIFYLLILTDNDPSLGQV